MKKYPAEVLAAIVAHYDEMVLAIQRRLEIAQAEGSYRAKEGLSWSEQQAQEEFQASATIRVADALGQASSDAEFMRRTRALRQLEHDGLIERYSPTEGKVTNAKPTDSGRALVASMTPAPIPETTPEPTPEQQPTEAST